MIKYRPSSAAAIKQLGDKFSLTFGQWFDDNRPSTLWPTCASCYHSVKKGPMFCQKYKMVPPVAIIVGDRGCEGYADDREIPF